MAVHRSSLVQQGSRGWALALTSVAFFMVALDALVVITALPAIQHDLRAGLSTLEWMVNAYSLTFAVGNITVAALGDRLGRRRVFAAGLALFSAASAAWHPADGWLRGLGASRPGADAAAATVS
ncbi:MAG: MFS transporter [Dehalococcoidia bacterium]